MRLTKNVTDCLTIVVMDGFGQKDSPEESLE